jgi:CRISPR-associated protein Cas2
VELLVAYDIDTSDRAGQRRLGKIAKICESYGVRVQYSVFECSITTAAREALLAKLREVIREDVDSVFVYAFPGKLESARTTLGRTAGPVASGPWIV